MVRKVRRGKMTGNIDAVWSWGEYANAKWRTVIWFCERCYERRVLGRLLSHKWECGCEFNLVGYGGEKLPEWLTIDATNNVRPSGERCQK
jgi:hypothetical protein